MQLLFQLINKIFEFHIFEVTKKYSELIVLVHRTRITEFRITEFFELQSFDL